MATTITITGSLTLDESLGLQNIGSPAAEDANDSDVSLATLQSGASAFSNRLFNSVASGGLGLSTTFATGNGVAESASNFITVSGGTVASLGFVKDDGSALPTYAGVATGGIPLTGPTSPRAVNGGTISLFADATLGNRMVLGVDANNDIVFAIFMDPNATLTSARVWTVQFEAISNPVATNSDDPVDLTGFIDVGASTFLSFTFDALHAGSNLFGAVGDVNNSIIVIAEHPKLKADGTLDSSGQVIKTSQGGTGATIGVDSQMFDPGEGAFFTYAKGSVDSFLAANLSQTEADDSASIQYGGGLQAATSASATISQTQGNAPASMKITAFDVSGTPQQTAFVNDIIAGGGAPVTITSVKVNGVAVAFTPDGNGVIVGGLQKGDTIEWTTSAPHERALIEGVAGKFDIGRFDITQTTPANVDIGAQLRFEDDGPTITASATGAPTLIVDETVLTTDAPGSFAAQFSPTFGTDGQGATPVSFALSTPGGASGLTDTATGLSVQLFKEGANVVGRAGSAAGAMVVVVSVDATGKVTLDQQRAVVHPDPTNPDDSKTLSAANLVVLTATATDGDGDQASAPLNIGQLLVFRDDGPSITASATGAPILTVDESVFATDANGSFAVQFTPTFGADGQGATPVSFALSTPGGASGLTDTATGLSVQLFKEGANVVGRAGSAAGAIVFVVSVDATGKVTLDQQRAVVPTNPDDSKTLSAANLVVLTATATDGDGDQASAPLNIGQLLVFRDDGPNITVANIASGTYTAGGSSTWLEAPNADGFKSLNVTLNNYTIDSNPAVTVNGSLGTLTTTDANGNFVFNGTINDDFNADGTSDTVTFKLTFTPANPQAYRIDLTTPPPTVTTFDTSQGSLAAGGPDPVQTLLFPPTGPENDIVFFAAVPTAPQTNGTVDSPPKDIEDLVGLGVPDLTESQIQSFLGPPNQIPTLINASTQLNVSTSGIGVNNNNLDGSVAG